MRKKTITSKLILATTLGLALSLGAHTAVYAEDGAEDLEVDLAPHADELPTDENGAPKLVAEVTPEEKANTNEDGTIVPNINRPTEDLTVPGDDDEEVAVDLEANPTPDGKSTTIAVPTNEEIEDNVPGALNPLNEEGEEEITADLSPHAADFPKNDDGTPSLVARETEYELDHKNKEGIIVPDLPRVPNDGLLPDSDEIEADLTKHEKDLPKDKDGKITLLAPLTDWEIEAKIPIVKVDDDGNVIKDEPTDGKPTDGKPTDSKPTDSKPTDSKPTDGKDTKLTDDTTTDTKTTDQPSTPKDIKTTTTKKSALPKTGVATSAAAIVSLASAGITALILGKKED